MKKKILLGILLLAASAGFAQSRFSQQEISINGFRKPSIGLEYRYRSVSVHANFYPTNFEPNTTTRQASATPFSFENTVMNRISVYHHLDGDDSRSFCQRHINSIRHPVPGKY